MRAAWLLALACGCYRPPSLSCEIACGADGLCPNGLACGPGNLCASSGEQCAGGVVDADPTDAPELYDAPQPRGCPSGLLACWLMDGDGTDGSGRGNHVTTSSISFTPGRYGSAALFANNDQMTVGITNSINLAATGGTVEAWLRPSAYPTSDAELRAGILDNNGAYSMFLLSDGRLRCSGGGGHQGGLVELDTWTHVACVWNGSDVTVVVDGIIVSTGSGTPGAAGSGDTAVDIGSDAPYTAGDGHYEGAVDDLRIWDRALSVDELCASAGLLDCMQAARAR